MPLNNLIKCQRLSCLNNPCPIFFFLSRSHLMLPCCIWIEMTLTFNTQIYLLQSNNFFFKKIYSIALQIFSFLVHRFDFKQAIKLKLSIRSKPHLHMLSIYMYINLQMYDLLILQSLRFSLFKIHPSVYNSFQPSFIINRHFNG